MSPAERAANRARYGSLKAEVRFAREVAALERQKNDLLARELLEPRQAFLIRTYIARLQPTRRAKRWLAKSRLRLVRRARHRMIQAGKRLARSVRRLAEKVRGFGVAAGAAAGQVEAYGQAVTQSTTAGAPGEKETP